MFEFYDVLSQMPPRDFAVFSALIGLFLGSFYNVCIDRMLAGVSIVTPPSHCESCGTRLRPWELVPILSWLALRGRCAHCGARVSVRYPLSELLSGVLAGVLGWVFGPTLAWLAAMVLTGLWLVMAGIDLRAMILPDRLTIAAAVLAVPASIWGFGREATDVLLGTVAGAGVFWLVGALYAHRHGEEGLGFGDVKLMLSIGAVSTLLHLPIAVILAGLGALAAFAVAALVKGSVAGYRLPFGPFLVAAGWVTMVAGDSLWQAWLGMVL